MRQPGATFTAIDFEELLNDAQQGIITDDTGASDALNDALIAIAQASDGEHEALIARAREIFAAEQN